MSTRPARWPGDDESKPAPGPLRLVQALVNTVERPDGSDRLGETADATPWLVDNYLLTADATLTEADIDLIRGVREALRALLVQNAGGPTPRDTVLAPLHEIASTGTARASLADDGRVRLRGAGGGRRGRPV